jgi:Kef-type K+ transport system membrane component KefB
LAARGGGGRCRTDRASTVTDLTILRDLGYLILAATAFVLGARAVRMPAIVAYIVAGLVVGPATGLVSLTESIEVISEFGIALLLFLVGLELSFDRIRDVGKVALVAGLGQVVFTAVGGFGVAALLGYGVIESIFIGTALTFSSTVVVVKLLDQKGELKSLYGRIAVGIFLVQDLVVVIMLTLVAGLGEAGETTAASALTGVVLAFAGMTLLLATAVAASRWVLPPLFRWLSGSLEAMFIASLCWCSAFVIGAELMALSLEIGAFLAGISLAQLPYNHELRRRVHPLMNFFIAVFFVSLGARMELDAALTNLPAAAALSLFVLIGNPVIFLWIIARLGYGERTAFLTSVTVAQISEFSFIFAALGLGAGLIDESVLSVIALVGLVTIGVSAYMILYNHELYARVRAWGLLRPFGARPDDDAEDAGAGLRGHIIVVGMNSLGRRLVRALADAGETVVAIDVDPAKLEGLPARTILGNVEYTAVLQDAELRNARLVVTALQIEDTNRLLAFRCRSAGVPCAVHAFDQSVVDDLERAGVTYLIMSKNEGIRRVAGELARAGVL